MLLSQAANQEIKITTQKLGEGKFSIVYKALDYRWVSYAKNLHNHTLIHMHIYTHPHAIILRLLAWQGGRYKIFEDLRKNKRRI